MGLHRKDLWRSLLSNWVIPEHIHWRSTRLLRKLSQLGLKSKESKHNKTRLPDSPHSTWRKQAHNTAAAAAAKSHQSCPTLCDPIDSSPPGFPIPGILQARTLEWVAISFFNAWKWKVKVKSLSHVQLVATPWTAAYQAPPSMGFSRQEYWSGVPLPSPQRSLEDCNPWGCNESDTTEHALMHPLS